MSSEFAKIPYHQGMGFYSALEKAHQYLMPRTYLEIGTATGASLAPVKCPSIAVDPAFRLDVDIINGKPACMLFNMGSDQFFEQFNPKILLNREVEIAFLDGMHYFEFLLRDFINTESCCKRNSIIFIHDCIPTDSHVARRGYSDNSQEHLSDHPGHWAGDLWKAIYILKKVRPELKIFAFDAPPTGLIAVTNLDPTSSILGYEYFSLVEEYRSMKLDQDGMDNYVKSISVESSDMFADFSKLSNYFWL